VTFSAATAAGPPSDGVQVVLAQRRKVERRSLWGYSQDIQLLKVVFSGPTVRRIAVGLSSVGRANMALAPPTPVTSTVDTSEYIGGITRELRGMALKADLGFLAYLLAMVADEAEAVTRRLREESVENPPP
jgi:hypothetical protein